MQISLSELNHNVKKNKRCNFYVILLYCLFSMFRVYILYNILFIIFNITKWIYMTSFLSHVLQRQYMNIVLSLYKLFNQFFNN